MIAVIILKIKIENGLINRHRIQILMKQKYRKSTYLSTFLIKTEVIKMELDNLTEIKNLLNKFLLKLITQKIYHRLNKSNILKGVI